LAAGQQQDVDTAMLAIADYDACPPTAVHLQDVPCLRGRAWAHLAGGNLALAKKTLWDAVALAKAFGQWASAAEAFHDLVRMGDHDAAQELEQLSGSVDGDFMVARLCFARAAFSVDPSVAVEAADRFEAIGANMFAAEAAAVEQRIWIERGLHRRAAAAGVRVQRHLLACEGPVTPPLSGSGPIGLLSTREREVALLAARNYSSRDIAEQLHRSVRTVDNHLNRVYAKLGISGRSELAEHIS
jgi:DNA-binding CsgD family transcriptional regulator